MGNTHAIKYLVQTLHDSDSDVRSIAAEELTKYEWHPKTELQQIALAVAKQDWQQLISIGTASVLSLISLLDDNNVNIRAAVVNALGEIGDSRAVEPLIQVHEKYANIYESDTNIRSIIVEALTKIDDPRAANFISEIKENDLVSVWDDDF
jgi:HEAT repeat protein